MKHEHFQQFAIVAADSAQLLTEKLNAKLYELRHKDPTVTFEGMIARISYQETAEKCETLGDEYALKGVRLTCQDCPLFEPIRKADGTEDKRVRWGDCPHGTMGRTSRDSRACDRLFEMMNSGEVRLCLADEQ